MEEVREDRTEGDRYLATESGNRIGRFAGEQSMHPEEDGMDDILIRIATCIERGKIASGSPYPPDLLGLEGAEDLVRKALEAGIEAREVLSGGLMAGMKAVGERFRAKKIFVPDVLMAARAMHAGMEHLRPLFEREGLKHRGIFVLGTVRGDLHDIGKRLVGMMVAGAGWEVVDLGIDVPAESFLEAIDRHPSCVIGLSALLTTTMRNMKETVEVIKLHAPATRVIIGGAPVTKAFADEIGADVYASDPPSAVDFLDRLAGGEQ